MPAFSEFEVSLVAIEPRIWRRFQLAETATFDHLHRAIQAVFDWESCHLWEFRGPGRRGRVLAGAEQDVLFLDSEETPDAQQVKLAQYFTPDLSPAGCQYIYDFGDTWTHAVTLSRRLSVAEGFHRRLLAGERACPPEDSGGVGGYARLVEFSKPAWIPWETMRQSSPSGSATGNRTPSTSALPSASLTGDAFGPQHLLGLRTAYIAHEGQPHGIRRRGTWP